jgi:hypothetical protein
MLLLLSNAISVSAMEREQNAKRREVIQEDEKQLKRCKTSHGSLADLEQKAQEESEMLLVDETANLSIHSTKNDEIAYQRSIDRHMNDGSREMMRDGDYDDDTKE